ncbi:MAG TPA: G5 domain-containing protein [Anaerolineales bacterium]|nr:G5 domain-containing protein [Anaerolineales bacterium]
MSACELQQAGRTELKVTITADGKTRDVSVPSGSTVTQALQHAGLAPGELDKSDPPFYTVLSSGDAIRLTRVQEKFETETQTIPFDRQVVRNESLPEGQERLVQAGVIGQEEITYRTLLEDGVQTSRSVVKSVLLQQAVPEIVMVGAQASFAPLPIPGKIAYMAGGNAWIMDTSTANRRLLVNTGDLDGRIFSLSFDGSYLLFTRKSKKPADQQINTLWAVSTKSVTPNPVWLKAANIIHFAAWYPNSSNTVAYSTVEPRGTAPGWQANNDLYKVGLAGEPQKILDAGSGGVYGWWGTDFAFSPDGRLAYARPDGIGLVSQDGGYLAPLIKITPLQTHSDWAWLPGIAWGGDGKTLYYVNHTPAPAPVIAEESPNFALDARSMDNDATVEMSPQVGMFSYPSASPMRPNGQEKAYQLAYLQAVLPGQSETSRYRLGVMDRDGSNRRVLFPPADAPGLEPQTVVWAPDAIQGQSGDFIAVVYQGNLWLIDSGSGQAYQVTGDGLITMIDWK